MITGACKERILAIGAAVSLALAFIAVLYFAPSQSGSEFPPINPALQRPSNEVQDIAFYEGYFQRAKWERKWEGIERAERINEQIMRRYHERWNSGAHPTAPFQPELDSPSPSCHQN